MIQVSTCNQSFESCAFQLDETDATIETNKDGNDRKSCEPEQTLTL